MKRNLLGCVLLCLLAGAWVEPASAQLSRPVACSDCIRNWFYFDNNGGAAGSQDWSCASSSYDGHRGSDFSLAGGNGAIDTGYDVVAAAEGVVESAQDGHFDHCTACGGSGCGTAFGFGFGNHVVVNHGGIKVVYAHLRTGSVSVGPGDPVSCGQRIGQIGSSGCSTGAHLHFETRPPGTSSSSAYDPFRGACGGATSRWNEQGAHRGLPGATCGPPPPPPCPDGTFSIWTCDGAERVRCIDGDVMRETCPFGCVSMPAGTDDVCDMSDCAFGTSWTCDGMDRARCVGGVEEREACSFGCMDGAEATCRTGPVDADMDGHNTSVDCDDANPTIFPGAVDVCGDGVDANCDGADACVDAAVGDAARADAAVADDAGVRADGSADPPIQEIIGGVSCSTAAGEGAAWFLLVALLFRRRR